MRRLTIEQWRNEQTPVTAPDPGQYFGFDDFATTEDSILYPLAGVCYVDCCVMRKGDTQPALCAMFGLRRKSICVTVGIFEEGVFAPGNEKT